MMHLENFDYEYDTFDSINKLINYIFKDKRNGKHNLYSGGFGVYNIYNAANEFLYVKNYFNQCNGKLVKHFCVSFEKKDCFINLDVKNFADLVCAYFCMNYQVVYSVHQDTQHIHVHFVVNTTSYINGIRLCESYEAKSQFSKYVKRCFIRVETESNAIIKNFKQQENRAWGVVGAD